MKNLLLGSLVLATALTSIAQNRPTAPRPPGPFGGPRAPEVQRTIFGEVNPNEIANFERQLDEVRYAVRRQNDKLSQLQQQLRPLQQRQQSADAKAQLANRNLTSAQTALNQNLEEIRHAQIALEAARAQRQREVAQATQAIAAAQSEVSRLESQKRQLESEISSLQGQVNPGRIYAIDSELNSLDQQAKPLETRKEEIEKQIKQWSSVPATNEMIIIMIHQLQSEIKEKIQPKLNEIAAQKSALLSEKKNLQDTQQRLDGKVADKNRVEQSLQTQFAQIGQQQAQLVQLQTRPFPEEARLQSLNTQTSNLQAAVRTAENNQRQAVQEFQQAQNNLDRLNAQISEAQNELNQAKTAAAHMERLVMDLRGETPRRRTVVIGDRIYSDQLRDLENSYAQIYRINGQLNETVSFEQGRDSVIYVLADTMNSVPEGVTSMLSQALNSGAIVFVYGNPDVLTRNPAGPALSKWLGVRAEFSVGASEIYGYGVLRNLELNSGTRFGGYTLTRVESNSLPETIIQNYSGKVMGTHQRWSTSSGYNSHAFVVGLDLGYGSLNLLGKIERTMCRNADSDLNSREVCRRR